MTDLDTLLEPLLRTPAHEPPPVEHLRHRVRTRSRRRRAALALGLVLAIGAPMLAVAGTGDDQPLEVRNPTATEPGAAPAWPGLPAGFTPDAAPSLFDSFGSPAEVAQNYFLDRLDAGPFAPLRETWIPDVDPRIGDPEIDPGTGVAVVPWHTAEEVGGHSGDLVMRPIPDEKPLWAVVAARVDGIDLGDVQIVDGVATGTIRSRLTGLVAVDVVGGDGTPVPGSPDPDGTGDGAGRPWGTAGTSDGGAVDVGVPVDGLAFVRARLVGDTFLAIAEVGVVGGAGEALGTTTTTTTTTSATTTTLPERAASPPWANAVLSADQAPATVQAWGSEGSPGAACPALAPADLGEGKGAAARATTRGQPGAWWVAYDLPGAPGEAEIQSPSADAGKETFSVSAIVMLDASNEVPSTDRFPNKLRWSDGSHGSYGPEGDGTLPMPEGVPYPWLAYLTVGDSPCLYQVHTYLGRDHLEHLIDQLRFVEGTP